MTTKRLLSTLIASLLCATAFGQTIKTLGYNTNGHVVAATPLMFTNEIQFQDLVLNTVLGTLFFSDRGGDKDIFFFDVNQDRDRARANLGFNTNLNTAWTATNAEAFRTNVGLGLSALSNTSNVTIMRALSGSTNTNHPYSGTVSVVGTNNTNTLTFSNGILQAVQ